ncbi:unnamed protein product [Enterobius vermicularis]|uniref:Pecanex-like protein n=1 Tax=Enterobius vermicularis TaxID=51028 RepID=A0A0N4VIP7_ENTVE|nr:unnamed protein product [Enterobius vermicularis]
MLGRLVNKFQQHSLSDEQSPSDNLDSMNALSESRRNMIPSMLYPNNFDDSGTESENEEELEQLETSYLMSIATDEMQLGPSPPVLTSSPPLISDFDTNREVKISEIDMVQVGQNKLLAVVVAPLIFVSWDSTGCESGIVVREQSEEPSDLANDLGTQKLLSVPLDNLPTYAIDTGSKEDTVAAGGSTAVNSGTLMVGSFSVKYGAFRPFRRRVKDQENGSASNDLVPSLALQGLIGEKRRYDNIIPKSEDDVENQDYGAFPRGASVGSGIPRETLVACRRTPVKLIIYNPDGVRKNTKQINISSKTGTNTQSESPPFRPVKRGRLNTCERPSLDFEKMRERMMTDWSSCHDDDTVEAENRIRVVNGANFFDETISSRHQASDNRGDGRGFCPHNSNNQFGSNFLPEK